MAIFSGTNSADTYTGTSGDDTIAGNGGGDTLHGAGGNDIINGGDGSDTINGGAGNDQLYQDAGSGTIHGDDGNDIIYGGSTGGTLYGDAGDDELSGISGTTTFYGGTGNDELFGGAGANYFDGGAGTDTFHPVAGRFDRITFNFGGSTSDSLMSAPDVVSVFKAGEDQVLLEGVGALPMAWHPFDLAVPGPSAGGVQLLPAYVGDGFADVSFHYDSTANRTFLWVDADDDGVLTNPDVYVAFTGKIDFTYSNFYYDFPVYRGSEATDTFNGAGNAVDVFWGGGGNDIINGNGGNDLLYGEAGDDSISGNDGDDLLDGGDGNDVLRGGQGGNDTFYGGGGDDSIIVEDLVNRNDGQGIYLTGNYRLTNTVEAGSGNDTVVSTVGNLYADLGVGNDSIQIQSSRGSVNGGAGIDGFSLDFQWEGAAITPLPNNLGNYLPVPDISVDLTSLWNGGTGVISTSVSEHTMSLTALERVDSIATFEGNDSLVIGSAYSQDIGSYFNAFSYTVGISTRSGNDSIVGGSGRDVIDAGAGNDIVDGGAGADVLLGRAGDDLYFVDNVGDIISEADGSGYDTVFTSASFALPSEVERILITDTGSTNAINLTGNASNNEMAGNAGANVIDGGAGADLMMGNAGDDTYYVDNSGDVVAEGTNAGYDTIYTDISLTIAASVERLAVRDAASTNALNLYGNSSANSLIGNAGVNVLDGLAGADSMIGLGGNDVYFVDDTGDDVVETTGDGYDTVFASASYRLGDNVERVVTLDPSSAAAINFTGNALDNEMTGNAGVNILDGGVGADMMIGGVGDDVYFVDNTADIVSDAPGGGYDTVFTSTNFLLTSLIERVVAVDGNATTAITLTGNEFANEITGNAGTNQIDGKTGSDLLIGGGGADAFVFSSALGGSNIDLLPDFVVGQDRIYLDHTIFGALNAGALSASAFKVGSSATDDDDRIIYDPSTGALYYDADGSGSGAAVQFAVLHEGLSMTASDLYVI